MTDRLKEIEARWLAYCYSRECPTCGQFDEGAVIRRFTGEAGNDDIPYLLNEIKALERALARLLEGQARECILDHHGNCQAHHLDPLGECRFAEAFALIDKAHARNQLGLSKEEGDADLP